MRAKLFIFVVLLSAAAVPVSLFAQVAEVNPYAGFYWPGSPALTPNSVGDVQNNQLLGFRCGRADDPRGFRWNIRSQRAARHGAVRYDGTCCQRRTTQQRHLFRCQLWRRPQGRAAMGTNGHFWRLSRPDDPELLQQVVQLAGSVRRPDFLVGRTPVKKKHTPLFRQKFLWRSSLGAHKGRLTDQVQRLAYANWTFCFMSPFRFWIKNEQETSRRNGILRNSLICDSGSDKCSRAPDRNGKRLGRIHPRR